jgi:NAD(P)H-nitrite reductase large subunit
MDCTCIMFAVDITTRDELARELASSVLDGGSGITIENDLRTSDPSIYALGECANWEKLDFWSGYSICRASRRTFPSTSLNPKRTFQKHSKGELSTQLQLLSVDCR